MFFFICLHVNNNNNKKKKKKFQQQNYVLPREHLFFTDQKNDEPYTDLI